MSTKMMSRMIRPRAGVLTGTDLRVSFHLMRHIASTGPAVVRLQHPSDEHRIMNMPYVLLTWPWSWVTRSRHMS